MSKWLTTSFCPFRESSCEAGESEFNESQEERSGSSQPHPLTSPSPIIKRKRLRKKKGVGLRKKLRTHIESVDEFNPEARDAQSAELERIRRLKLQRSLSNASEGEALLRTVEAGPPNDDRVHVKEKSSSSPEILQVQKIDLSQATRLPNKESSNAIVIDSGSSDSDSSYSRAPPLSRPPPPSGRAVTSNYPPGGRGQPLGGSCMGSTMWRGLARMGVSW